MKIRIFLADDHGVLRGGLRALINAQSDMEVVGDAADGVSAEHGILEMDPDVAVMDISMPGRGGLETIVAVRQKRPMTRVLVLTVHDEPGYLRAAVQAGALGYVVKSAADTELLAAIRAVARGRAFTDIPIVSSRVAGRSGEAYCTRGIAVLSDREREVLGLVAEGYANREIADALGLSVKSVETYRARVMEKLGLSTRSDLVRFALECGVLAAGKSAS
jgi:two-component system, NarL family, response regulator NreC